MTADSLFDFMRSQRYTSLRIDHDRNEGTFRWSAAREWGEGMDWSTYGQSSDMMASGEWFDDERVLEAIASSGTKPHASAVMDLMTQGRHERLELVLDGGPDIRFLAGIHSTVQGPPAGGIRRHPRTQAEIAVIADILNLGRGMSFKDAAAMIPNGGCKLGVHSSLPFEDRDERFYGFLGYCIDRSDAFTGPDMGFSLQDADRIRQYTHNIVGGTSRTGSGGATGVTAGWGVFLGMEETLKVQGKEGMKGIRVAIQGVGELGAPLVEHLLEAGAQVVAADIAPEAMEARLLPIERRIGRKVTRVHADQILGIDCDILAPCAIGGVIGADTVSTLCCSMIVGGANNQLDARSKQQEIAMAAAVAGRGILFVPDFIVNAGGVIQGKMEHVRAEHFRLEDARAETGRIVPGNVRDILVAAKNLGITPLEAAYRKFEPIVYG